MKLGTECERASLLIVDAVAEQLVLISHDKSLGMRLPLTSGVAGQCATTGNIVLVADAYAVPTQRLEPMARRSDH